MGEVYYLFIEETPGIEACIGCLNINVTHVTANNSSTNDNIFFFLSDMKIVYYY